MKTKNNDINYLLNVKELLITIDMLNGFIKEGTLAAPSIMRIVPRQIELLRDGLRNKDTGLVFIRDSHVYNANEFKTYPPHCIANTKESEVIDELKEYVKYSLEYLKNSTNLIFAPNLQNDLLKFKNLKKVSLIGCLSEVCVLNGAISLKTFFDQYNKDVSIFVYADAIDTFNTKEHNADLVNAKALQDMQNNGIKVFCKK